MEHEMLPNQDNKVPFHIEDVLGDILKAEEECPGVYYVAARRNDEPYFAREYYVIAADTPVIPQKAKKYGHPIPGCPGILLYSMQEERSGYRIIHYEIAKYRTEHGIPLPDGETLHELKAFHREHHPEYFGPYPVPTVAPGGSVLRHHVIDNGVYWLEMERNRPLLSICYPIWTELSDYAIKFSRQEGQNRKQEGEETPDYLFFSETDSCVPIFELLLVRNEWETSGMVNKAALMNAIWSHHPEYAALYNAEEQTGRHDTLGLLLQTFGKEVEPKGNPQNMIQLTPDERTDFLHFRGDTDRKKSL